MPEDTTPVRGPLAVVYDRGAATPTEIAQGLAGLCVPVFVVPASPHVAQARPVLARLGDVVELSGDIAADARRLRAINPRGIVTFSEPMLRATAALAATLDLPFHDLPTVTRLTDKLAQRTALAAAGVDSVRTWLVRAPEDVATALAHVGLPAVIKPRHGEGSRDTHLVTDERAASDLLTAGVPSAGVLIEEYLQGAPDMPFGDYVSVESLAGRDGVSHLAITGKFPLAPPFRETGQFWPAPLTAQTRAAVLDLTTRALRALGVTVGFTHTEIKLTADGPRLIEVNGRLGGHINMLYRHAFDADMVRAAAMRGLGETVQIIAPSTNRVYFQHSCLAPTVPCRLVRVDGARHVRRLPGVIGYQQRIRPGSYLCGGVMTQFMDLLWGVCDNHEAMRTLIAEALDRLTFEFETADGSLRLTGQQLRGSVV